MYGTLEQLDDGRWGERAAGALLRFGFPDEEWPAFDGEMVTWDPPAVMELRWGPDLTLLDTLEELGKAARDGAGWHTCLDALEGDLDGTDNPREAMAAWKDVHAHYAADFGPEAAALGPPARAQ